MATLCAGTPKITVRDNRGLDVRALRYNRNASGAVAAQYVDAQTHNALGQPTSSQDPRFFNTETLNFQYTPALSGQGLRTVSVDAGTAEACADIGGQPIWQHSQGRDANIQSDDSITVQRYYDALGRPVQRKRITLDVSTGASVDGTSDIWCYGDYRGPPSATYDPTDTTDPRNANQRGQLFQHFDTAGLIDMSAQGYAVQGAALRQDRRFQAAACDSTTHWQPARFPALYPLNKQWLESDTDPDNLYSTRWAYNALGQVLTQGDAKGHQRHTAYDSAGRKCAASVNPKGSIQTPVTTAITYTAAGSIDTRSDANNIQVIYAYEPQTTQRLISITATRVSIKLQALTYAYDGVGNVIALSDSGADAQVSFFRNRAVTPDRGYTYDALYQLTSATGRENYVNNTPRGTDWPGGQFTPATTPEYQAYTRSYTYDAGGNLTTIRSSNWSGATPSTRQLVVGNSSNRAVCTANNPGATQANIDTYFDLAGQSICLDANRNQPMYWTAFHQLYCVVTTYRPPAPGSSSGTGDWSNSDREQYAYDGSGERVRKYASSQASNQAGIWNSLDTRYLPGLELRGNTATGENLEVIVLDDGARVLNWTGATGKPSDIPNQQLRYQYSDRQNSCQIETDSDGNVITQEEYYPYGGTAVLASKNNSEVKYKYIRYSGKERDATGLYYYGLRYYQPWIGRWINPDPAGPTATQNLYCMVSNNPVTMIDAYGAVEEEPRTGRFGNLFGCFRREPAMSRSSSPSYAPTPRAMSLGDLPWLEQEPLGHSAAATAAPVQENLATPDGSLTSRPPSSNDGYRQLASPQGNESDAENQLPADPVAAAPDESAQTVAPVSWYPEDKDAEANLSAAFTKIGVDWVPMYSSWLQDPRGPRAAASDTRSVLDIKQRYGDQAADRWDMAIRYVTGLHEAFVPTEEQRFARLCELGEIKTAAWDKGIRRVSKLLRKPQWVIGDFNESLEQRKFEKWMIEQEKQAPQPPLSAGQAEQSSGSRDHPDDEAAWARYTYVSNELLHVNHTVTATSGKTIGYTFDTVDPQRPGHQFSSEVSADKIRLKEAYRPQKTKEYYANDVTAVQLCAAMRKGIATDEIQLMELTDIVNSTTLGMLNTHNDSRKSAPHIGADIWYDRWSRQDPRFVEFFANPVHGKRVARLLDDMGKTATALWRLDRKDEDGDDRNDLFVFMEQAGKARHPALR
ncbi:RHS repeat-associated core domain-containing protein [Bordetella sp. LUAb4]|uniref:RHS repeat-associated core domain-containing protein n=1 Tax=Bordetella sp. LUAb4 TaxID=2843195 RepID=UPI001E5A57FD|nr:RHS repeat-associated core domain-containing protein [Bordetella sp. LUAb4]